MMIARKALSFAALVAAGLLLEKAAWGVFDSAAVPTGTPLKVQRVVPEGNQVPAPGRQIVVTFDRPVKTIGDLSVAAGQSPVSVSPAVACQWHWLDPRALACELNDKNALVPATRYTVTVAPGIKSQDGAVLESEYAWSFTTERPAVTQYSFKTWESPGMPVIRLVFNQAVVQETVQSSLHFGAQTSVVAKPDPYDRDVFYVLPLPGEPGAVVLPQGTPAAKSESRRVWLVSPTQELRANTTVQLKVTPGLKGYQGPLLGTERRTVVSFDTFCVSSGKASTFTLSVLLARSF